MQKRYWADCNRTIQWFFQQIGMEAVILTNPNLEGRYLRYRDQEPLDCLKKFHSAQIRIDKRAEAPEKAAPDRQGPVVFTYAALESSTHGGHHRALDFQ